MILALTQVALAGTVDRYAIVVGANEGIQGDQPLLFAERDATRVADVLEELGGIPAENVLLLRDVNASRLDTNLASLAERIEKSNVDGESLVFFYYSGHGDADGLHLAGTEFPFEHLVDRIQALPVNVRILVVDACQSGELTRLKGATPAAPFAIQADDRLDTEGMAIITSSSIGEDAQESDRLQGGIFTHHFLVGLKGAADASGDKRITLTEAYQYGYDETVKSTSRARFVQRPGFGFRLTGRNDLVLTRVGDSGRSAFLALDSPGHWLVMEGAGTGDLVSEVYVENETLLAVAPGDYLLRHRDPYGIREASLRADRGQTHPMVVASMRSLSPGRTVRKGYEDDQRVATAWTIGSGLIGPTTPGLAPGVALNTGLLFDFEPMTMAVRLVGAYHRNQNDQLRLQQGRLGADIAGLKKFDVRRTAIGLGVRSGLDVTRQWFETTGRAPAKQALTGRVGPLVSLDVPFGRNLLVFSGGTDIQLYQRYDVEQGRGTLDTAVVPTLNLEFAHYVR